MESWWEMERMMFERRGQFCRDFATCTFTYLNSSFVMIEIFHFFSANTGYSSTSASTLTTLSNNTSHLTVPQSSISPSLSPTSTVVSSTEIENIIANKKKF